MDPAPIVAEIERTRTRRGRETTGLFSVEGFRLVERALRAGADLRHALFAASLAGDADPRARPLRAGLERAGCPVSLTPDAEMERLLAGRDAGPVIALVGLPPARALETVLPATGSVRLIVTVDVEDPGNLGALARTALVGGADALVVAGLGDPYHPRAVRISRGSLFRLPVVRLSRHDALLPALRRSGVASIASLTHGGEPLPGFDPGKDGRWAICLGSEASGLPAELARSMDRRVSIPMADAVDSYSVHGAAAILLYALRRDDEASGAVPRT